MISIGNLQINKLCLGDVEVTKAYLGDVEVYNSTQEPLEKYTTMTVLDGDAGTTISPKITGSLPTLNLQYRVNNGSWNDFIVGTTADIHAVAGDVVQFKGVNESGVSNSSSNYLNFSISGNPVSLSGNVMSLIDGVGDALVIPRDYCFYRLFHGSSIKTVSHYFLPATTLTNGCYFDLFSGSLLENAPELPALIMKDNCYRGMFYGCKHFTQAISLPATTLANGCYAFMLAECSSLVQVPALHATELATECYRGLFQNSTALTQAPALPATKLANYCYKQMFYGCSALVNAPKLPATVLAQGCYDTMFFNCSSLTTPPELPATVITDSCYYQMFYNCNNLLTAPELPGENLDNHCYERMFMGCQVLEQAPVLNCTTLVDNCYKEMFKGCWALNYVKSMATKGTINADGTAPLALQNWLYGVPDTGTFVKPAAAVYVTDSPSGIPTGWTVVEEKPYMTMTVDESNTGETIIHPNVEGSLPNLNLQYRINNGKWTDFIVGTTADITAQPGDVVQWKGNNPNGVSTSYNDYLNFAVSGNPVALSGNVMSLIDGVGETLVIPNKLCFYYLFYNSAIKTVSSDFLPATTLNEECYRGLFSYCNKLTQAPELPATTLKTYCYEEMFSGCSALKQAPELHATTLVDSCYNYMFMYCSSLNYVKCLATDNISTIFGWLSGVSSTGTFVKPAGVSYKTGENGIPEGWTIQDI